MVKGNFMLRKFPERALVLTSDILGINFAFLIYYYFRVASGWFDMLLEPILIVPMLFFTLYWLTVFTFGGMYRKWFAQSRIDEITTLLKTTLIGSAIIFFVIFVDDMSHNVNTGQRWLIVIYWFVLFFLVSVGRFNIRTVQRKLLINGVGRRNTLIVGFNEKSNKIHSEIQEHRGLGLDVIGYLTAQEENFTKSFRGAPVLGQLSEVEEIVKKHNVQEIIIGLSTKFHDEIVEVISRVEGMGIGLKMIPDLYDILSGQAKTTQLYAMPLIDINPQLLSEWEKVVKRTMDIVVALVGMVLSFPIVVIASIAIKIDSKGPILFAQERSGLNGKVFRMYKFRSMRQDAEKVSGPVWAQKDDPRVTKVGKFIRKVRIDEIPQMINVLKGEMSLVGPRPERPYFVEKLSKEIPYYKRRLKVKPGVTGWAQVKHKYDETIEDVKQKLQYDLFYIENISIKTDVTILFRTIFVVLFGKGHYE